MRMEHPKYQQDLAVCASAPLPWDKLQDTTLLLTGATGLIGTFLCDLLMYKNKVDKLNITVVAVGRNKAKAEKLFSAYVDSPFFHFLPHDVNTPLPPALHADFIIHGASNAHPLAYAQYPIETITTNVFGAYYLMKHAVDHDCRRFLLLSSVEIYGDNQTNKEAFWEEDLGYIDCNTLRAGYPESKRTAEALCQAFKEQAGLDVVTARLCRLYGPTMTLEDSKALAQFIRKAAGGEDIVLKSKGQQYFSFCYVADAATAILTILTKGVSGQAYNVADDLSNIYLGELAQKVAAAGGQKVVFELPDSAEQKGYSAASKAVLNADKLTALGWKAHTHLEQGVAKTIELLKFEAKKP